MTTVNFALNVEFVNLGSSEIENGLPDDPSFIPQLPDDFFFPVWYEVFGSMKGW